MTDWIVQAVVGSLIVPMAIYFLKMHADLVYRQVPDGFSSIKSIIEDVKKEQEKTHRDNRKHLKRLSKDIQAMQLACTSIKPSRKAKGKSKPSSPPCSP